MNGELIITYTDGTSDNLGSIGGTIDERLAFSLLDNGTYSVSIIDTPSCKNSDADIIIPNEHNGIPVTAIADNGFKDCKNVVRVGIPNSITTIGQYAFFNCRSLIGVTIPKSVTSIGDYAFGNCVKLSNIALSNGLVTIGSYTFSYCEALESIAIPTTLTNIGAYAFEHCYSLKYAYFEEMTWEARTHNPETIHFPRENLLDPSKAAQYLTDYKVDADWRKLNL